MAQILCDCGCGKTVTKPVFFSNAHRMAFVRGGAHNQQNVRPNARIVRQDTQKRNAPVAVEYEFSTIEGRKVRRLGPGYDWEGINPNTGKWQEI